MKKLKQQRLILGYVIADCFTYRRRLRTNIGDNLVKKIVKDREQKATISNTEQ